MDPDSSVGAVAEGRRAARVRTDQVPNDGGPGDGKGGSPAEVAEEDPLEDVSRDDVALAGYGSADGGDDVAAVKLARLMPMPFGTATVPVLSVR